VILLLAVCLIQPAFAAENQTRLLDEADLLTDSEEAALSEKLDRISTDRKLDVVIVTVSDTGDKTATECADEYYKNGGYADDGILLLISRDGRQWAVSTSGYGITAFTDAGLAYLTDKISDLMSEGKWNEAFERFTELCDEFIVQARNGKPYDKGNLPKKPFNPILTGIVSLGIGFVIAFFRMGKWRNQLYTVLPKTKAADYVKSGSFRLTEQNDLFLYKRVERREKSKDSAEGSTTHTSASGETHGGASGKF